MNAATAIRRIETHKLGDAYLFATAAPLAYAGAPDESGDHCTAYADYVLVIYERHADSVSVYLCDDSAQMLEPGQSVASLRGIRHPLHAALAEAGLDY